MLRPLPDRTEYDRHQTFHGDRQFDNSNITYVLVMLVDGVFWLVPQDLRIIISQRSRYRIITQRGVAVLPTMVESPPTHGDLSGAGYKKLMSSVPIFILQHQHPFSVAMRFTLTLLGSLILFVAGLVQETNAQNPPVPEIGRAHV